MKVPFKTHHRPWKEIESDKKQLLMNYRQACSPLIQLFFGFASDIDQTNIEFINKDIIDGNWLSRLSRARTHQ